MFARSLEINKHNLKLKSENAILNILSLYNLKFLELIKK